MSQIDPVLRCDSCGVLVKIETIHQIGCCHECGNKRIRTASVISQAEMDHLEACGAFDDFLMLYDPKIVDGKTMWRRAYDFE